MTTAKQTTVSELPRAIAEAMGWFGRNNCWYSKSRPYRRLYDIKNDGFALDIFDPLNNNDQFHEFTGDPETHAKICGVLDEWFTTEWVRYDRVLGYQWYENPTYLTKNGGWRAWWLRAYLQVLRDGGDEK